MARPSNSPERRTQIAAALVKVMARHGYDGSSVADVARAARLAPGLVHYHYKNKQEILIQALRQLAGRHEERLAARLDAGRDDPAWQVAAFIDLHLGLGADADPEALHCWILLSGEALRERKVQVEYEKVTRGLHARLTRSIVRGVEQGAFRCDAPEAAASALIAAVQGYFVLAGAARSLIPRGSAAACTKRMAEGLLRPARPLPERTAP